MSDDTAPWWASADADALADDEDPLARHLAARARGNGRGPHVDGADGRDGTTDDDPDESAGAADRPVDDDTHDRCGYEFCPLCRGLDSLRRTHPEVATHLAEAARHLSLALREVADTLATSSGGPSDEDAPDFESIPIDDVGDEP